MRYLRQSTSVDLPIGPFLDNVDGFTAETALTITQPDIRLKKNGAAWAQKAAAQTLSHEEAGWYEVTLDATDTDTCGQLMLSVQETGALPVWCELHVLEEVVYDALFAASAPGYLQSTVAARTLDVSAGGEAGIDWANIGSPTTAQNLSATNIDVDQVVASVSGAVGSVTGAVGSVASGGITAASIAADAITAAKIADGAIDAATFAAGAINAAAIAADAITDAKVASDVTIASVTGAVGSVTGAVGSVTGNVGGNVTGSVGSVATGGIVAASFAANAINAAKLDPDVTTELQAGLATAAALATVDGIVDDILLDTAEIGAAGAGLTNINLPNQTMDIVGNITGNLSGSVGSVTGNVGGNVTGTIGGLTTAAKAEVQQEAEDAIVVHRLDELMNADSDIDGAAPPTVGSVFHELMTKTAGSFTYDQTTDALEAIRDNMGTAQTGDSFARLGAPAGASVSADLAAIEAQTDDIGVAGAGLTALGDTRLANLDATISSRATQTSVDDLPTNAELATSQAAADDATLAAIAALNNLSAAQVNSEVDTALADIHLDHLLAVDYDPASQPGVATALLNELIESDAGVSRYTANALEQAPTGGSAPTVGQIADGVWDELLSGHVVSGSAGEALAAAGTAGDPWTTALPGAYGAGTAGKIVGDNVNATISSRASQASLDVVDGIADNILLDTAEIGAAGAGLTNIDLPNQTMNITGNITGNLSGSVGSVTGSVGSVTAGVTLAASAVQAIWDALTSALTTVGSIGKLLVDNVNATISSRSSHSAADVWAAGTRTLTSFGTLAADVWASVARTLTAATNITSTGGTTVPQTGDSFARLGAPAGASVSADLAAIEAQTDDIGAAGAGLTALATAANLATVDTVVDSILALLVDARVEPGQGAPAATEDPLTKLDFLYKMARNRITQDATTLKVYADDAVTVDHKATVSDSGTLYDRGEIVTGP